LGREGVVKRVSTALVVRPNSKIVTHLLKPVGVRTPSGAKTIAAVKRVALPESLPTILSPMITARIMLSIMPSVVAVTTG
jgi:hypothetical protein